jgi:hypothetical protein
MSRLPALPLFVCALLLGCGERAPSPPRAPAATPEAAPPPTPAPRDAGPIPADEVQARVAASSARLLDSDGGRLVWDAIEAHGGLDRWLAGGTLGFDFDYRPLSDPAKRRHTRNRVDLWSARAVHEELGEGADATFGWDGEVSWIVPGPDAFPGSVRFWATTPYYFVGMPFVLADPATRFEVLPDADREGTPHHLVKVTYEDGTGDSPDDYYVVYLHPETRRMSALRYVVAYPAWFEDGEHSPEKLMTLQGLRDSDGLLFASTLHTFGWDETAGIGEQVTAIEVGPVTRGSVIPGGDFAPPPGATVSDQL